jgi:thiol-disulfide isomerase/thioredoxin
MPMRTLRTTWAAAWLLGLVGSMAPAADELTTKLLTFHPSLKGVEYDLPTEAAALAACKGEAITGGYQLRDGQGKILCRLMCRNNPGKVDQWSYYQDGFEFYRELDNNGDKSLDEVRWVNTAGTRIGKVFKGKIVSWSRISAEEASKVFVQALVSGDSELIETVMASPAELEALGIPKGEIDAVAAAEKQRVAQLTALRAGLVGWDSKTTFMGLSGAMPHLIPADAGLKDDVILCESATIFAGSATAQANAGKMAFLQVGEMVKIGETWKFVDLPRVIDPSKTEVIPVVEGGIRSWVFRDNAANAAGGENPQVAQAMQALAAFDANKTNQALMSGGPKEQAQFHVGRVGPLNKIVKAAEAAGDLKIALDHQKLIVDSLAAAYATGQYQPGAKLLDDMSKESGKVATYAAYKKIEADFALQNEQNPGNPAIVMDTWLTNLQGFVDKHPRCDEAPPAMMLLASSFEMNGKEAEARKWYAALAKEHPATEWGKKADGAIRRLEIVGKALVLKGVDLRGTPIDIAQYRGKTVLVTFWATWASPAKKDLPELAKLHAKYKAKGFEVVAINLDNEKVDLDAFLQTSPLAWPQIFEPGGMENRLATEFGIISLPTMFLVDPDGKVVNRSFRSAAELEVLLDKNLAGKVAIGPK